MIKMFEKIKFDKDFIIERCIETRYDLSIKPTFICFNLFHKNTYVGYIALERYDIKSRKLITHSKIEYKKYRGKKIGSRLYIFAINWAFKNKYSVISSHNTSDLAKRVWRGKTIRKHFIIGANQYRFFVKGKSK